MNRHSDDNTEIDSLRRKIIGLGDSSGRKTYYLELQDRLEEVEGKRKELEENNRLMASLLEDLKDSEQKYRGLVDNALVGIFRSTTDDKFLYVNDALVKIFGCESADELLSTPISSRYRKPEDRQSFLDTLMEKGKLPYYEIRILTPSGQQKTLAASVVLQNGIISGVNVDITEQKSLEEQLRQAQKMEAIGVLAGGIAHDFNNILAAILGFAELLRMRMTADAKSRTYIDQILNASERASQLTHSLLAFSRKQVMTIGEVDLNDLVAKLGKLLVRVIGEDIELRTVLQPKSTPIMADGGQIEQIIMNLATNARDAMPNGGILTIVSGLEEVDRTFCEAHGCETPGRYALLTVSDTGTGMDEDTKKRIFDPFFTTKETGRGTGLGLAMVYGIVHQHNGFIDVESEPTKGTTFRVYIPVREAAAAEKSTVLRKAIAWGAETILVAEDDPTVRELTQIVLESYGYHVIPAVDGQDAVAKYVENKDNIDLVILDMIMPKMSGLEAYKVIKDMKPEIKALFLSGYTADKIRKEGLIPENVGLAAKPISQHDLLITVRHLLDNRSAF